MNVNRIISILEHIQTLDEYSYGENNLAIEEAISAVKFSFRAKELLTACAELFDKQFDSPYVLNLLEETVFYDGVECDGDCLAGDIADLLEYGE